MSTELERRLADLGSWLDQAAPEVRFTERSRRGGPEVVETSDVDYLETPLVRSQPGRAWGGRLVGAAAVVLVLAVGLVAVSRRSLLSGTPGKMASDAPTTAAPADLGGPWAVLVSSLLPRGFTEVATRPSTGKLVVAMDDVGRTITVLFMPGGANSARTEWEGMDAVTLTTGVASGNGSNAVVVTSAGDSISALCWLGDDVCTTASVDPPVDVRPMLEALGRAVTDANRPSMLEVETASELDGLRATAVFGRFGSALGSSFALSTSGGDVARQSWAGSTDVVQRVSLQIVPDETSHTVRGLTRTDLVTASDLRNGVLYIAVSRTTDGTPVAISADQLRDLLTAALDDAALPASTTTPSASPGAATSRDSGEGRELVGVVTLNDGARYGVVVSSAAFCLTTGDGKLAGCDGAPATLSPAFFMVSGYGSGTDQLLYGVADAGLTVRVVGGDEDLGTAQTSEPVGGRTVFMAIIPPGVRVDVEIRRGAELVKRFENVVH